MDWLEALGLPVVERRWAKTGEQAAAAAGSFDRPVAMKIVSPEIVHKTDAGGVALGVRTKGEVRATFQRLRDLVAKSTFHGVLVSPMISDAVEVLVGLSRDPQFGPVIAVGLGGIYTELLGDVALRVAPIGRDEAATMIDGLRGAPILRGVRGQAARDLDALADLLARVSELPFRFPEIEELDLNPVFLLEQGAKIGDVRLVRTQSHNRKE